MKTYNIKTKQVGNFVISHLSNREVAISFKGQISGFATQMLTHEMVDGFLTPTGTFCDLPFNGFRYPGIIFKKPLLMSRKKLENFLEHAQ